MDSDPNSVPTTYKYPSLQSPLSKPAYSVNNTNPKYRGLLPDEVEVWNNCLREGVWKCGIPYAVLCQFVFNRFRKKVVPNAPYTLRTKGWIFGTNFLLGFFFYTPFCINKVYSKFLENEEKLAQKDQFSLQQKNSDNFDNLNTHPQSTFDTESSFSHLNLDFNPSLIENMPYEDSNSSKEEKIKTPHTTYEELRNQNRENYNRGVIYPRYTPPKTERPKSTKNKYGDEME